MTEKKRILIVEDEKMLQELYYTILTRKQYQSKYEVVKAASAEEALHLFEQQSCDLVFTDYHLPKMDGLTLIKKLNTTAPKTNFILISGYFSPPIIRLAVEAGAYTCLKKPCSMYKIIETIEETFNVADKKGSHLKQIFETIKDFQQPALFITGDMQIVSTNELFIKNYNNYQGKKCYDILCPSKQLCLNCPLTTAKETNTTVSLEHTIKSGWESLSSIKEKIEPWRSPAGELYGYVLKLIPTGKHIEQLANEEQSNINLNNKDTDEREFYTFIVDADDRFLHVDEHFAAACEVNPDQMEGKYIASFLHSYFSEYLKKEEKRFVEFAKENEKKKVKLDFIKQESNQRFTLTCEFRKIGPGFGPGQKLMVICRDKEESEELNKLIEFERETSKQLLVGQFDMVVTLGSDLSIKTMNNICENKLKIKKQELLGKAITCLLPKNNDQRFFNQAVKQVDTLKDVYNIRLDIGIKRKLIPTLVNISGIRNHFNNEIGYVMVLRDIEKELKMEATLSNVERMQALGQLAAGIAHQINNYTAALSGSTDIFLLDLREDDLTSERLKELGHEYIKTIKTSLSRLAGLTKHLTSFARAQQRPVISLGSVNKIINDVISLIELNIKKKHILLMVSLDEHISPIYLSPLHLEQAVMNILMNAIDAVSESNGVIKIKTYQEMNWAYIIIEDNGPGIPEHIKDQVFEAFVTTKPAGVGTGLGLNVARDMITSLKGEIELVSEQNTGTKAIIKLPILSQEEIA